MPITVNSNKYNLGSRKILEIWTSIYYEINLKKFHVFVVTERNELPYLKWKKGPLFVLGSYYPY